MKPTSSTPNKARRPDLEPGDNGDRARARELAELEAADGLTVEERAELDLERRRRPKPATK